MKYVWPLPRRAGLLFSMVFSDLLMVCVGGAGVEPAGRNRVRCPQSSGFAWGKEVLKARTMPVDGSCRAVPPEVPYANRTRRMGRICFGVMPLVA